MTLPLRTLRIGFVLDSPDPSGVGEHLCTLAPRLVARGYSVHLVCRSAGAGDQPEPARNRQKAG